MKTPAFSVCLIFAAAALLPLKAAQRVDHGKFQQLKGPFKNGPEVTRACLSCHSQVGVDLLSTSHWLWRGEPTEIPGRPGQTHSIGKANLINNFCTGIQSNEHHCTKCHIGFGWQNKSFNFTDPNKIDCIVCHDGTGDYTRTPLADELIDWVEMAKNVGPTSIQTCGSCHFRGGGGEAVKHGDLDPSLTEATRELDLHMASDGLGFSCSSCHRGEEIAHRITGHSPSVSPITGDILSCAKCHGDQPHGKPFVHRTQKEKEAGKRLRGDTKPVSRAMADRLNWHARTLACQTCHIPIYATQYPTKTWWDWSAAGRLDENGRPVQETDEEGNITYLGSKGTFKWEKNLKPEYLWYNGQSERYLIGDSFNPKEILSLNRPMGKPGENNSKIWPFKIMRGKQIFDRKNGYLIQAKIYGEKGSGAYGADFDWDKAARAGMSYINLPYSGSFGFAETEMHWPLSHMTLEGKKALSCVDCHSKEGRLEKLPGIYIPGQHRLLWLEIIGWGSVLLTILGVLLHAVFRWLAPHFRNRRHGGMR